MEGNLGIKLAIFPSVPQYCSSSEVMALSNDENILVLFGSNTFLDLSLPRQEIPIEELTATIDFLKEPVKPPAIKKKKIRRAIVY